VVEVIPVIVEATLIATIIVFKVIIVIVAAKLTVKSVNVKILILVTILPIFNMF